MTRVLLIEDDRWLSEILASAFDDSFAVEIAHDPIDAMTKIDTNLPDVIVLDVLLTATTAFTLLHELQSYVDTAQIPVILCTSLASTLSHDDVAAYGVRQIIDKTTMKPIDLVRAVRSVT